MRPFPEGAARHLPGYLDSQRECGVCKAQWLSLLTGTWHTMERSESSEGKENQKGQDNSHTDRASLEQIPRAEKKPRGGKRNLSSERALLYVLWVKRGSLWCEGAPPPAGTLQNEFFFFCPGSAHFRPPPSRAVLTVAPVSQGAGAWQRGGSLPGTGTKLLSKNHSFDNFLLR